MTSIDPSDLNIRLDQLLYYLRIFKTRGIATKAIEKDTNRDNIRSKSALSFFKANIDLKES